ncbi:hypothetical protein HPB52_009560 [Rhipicephalus sanguineus]|uniref:Uncharacterized protein n=1 Tax=Rhipicephalus sanguineus TaxID=34632 RepID=A0A9D4T3J0_RHISA|nr:hypothetical protein HPB52_009560 [Rhipicephalus sanguineus]
MAQGSSGKADKARNLLISAENMEDLMSAEDNDMIKAPKNKRRRGRKKDKRDKRRERRDKRKKLNSEEAEGLEDAHEFPNGDDDYESEVTWSPPSAPSTTDEEKRELRFEMFFDMMNDELGLLRDNIESHERQLLDFAAPLVCRIPQPPKPYITQLCCCTKCCGRCCDIYGHQQKVMHPPLTADVGTDSMDADEMEDSRKKLRKRRPFTPDMELDTTGVGYGEDFGSLIPRKGLSFKADSADSADSDSESTDDFMKRSPRGTTRHLTATKVIRRKSHELRRTPTKTSVGSSSGTSTPVSDLMRKAKLARKRFAKKRLSGGQQRKSLGKQSPRLSLQDALDVPLSGGPAPLEGPNDTLGVLSGLTSPADWQSPTNNYDLLNVKARSAPQYLDISPTVVRSELLYYMEHSASPWMSGEGPLRAVQSSPIDLYSMRMTPDAQLSFARQGQFNEWPPLRPPPAQLYQDRRLPPLTAAAWDLSGKANAMAKQAKDTFDAAKVLKKASDDAFEVAMKNQYFDGRVSDQVSMSSMERGSQESMFANRSVYPLPVRMEVPQQQAWPQPQQQLQQSIPESRPVAKSILKNTASSNKSLPSRNLGLERSFESSFLEDDRSFSKPPPSLALGPKLKIKQAEAEAGGEASKSEGRPRARFANLPTETTPRKTAIRRRGSVFVSGSLLPDEDDEDENKTSSMKTASDESFTMKASAPSDAAPSNSVDAVQRLKLSISSSPNVQSKKPEMDNELEKRQDLTSPVNADISAYDGDVQSDGQPGHEHEVDEVNAVGYGPVNPTVRKASIPHNQPTGADVREASHSESLPAHVDHDETALEEGVPEYGDLQDDFGNLGPEDEVVGERAVEVPRVDQRWIILLIFLTEMHHGWFSIYSPTTSSLGPTSSHTVQTRPYPFPTPPPPEPSDITITDYPTYPPTVTETDVPQMDIYYCATAYCDKEARYLSSFVLGDPCENFYEDICVNRTRMWPQPAPGASTSTNSMIAEQIQASALWYINDDRNNDVKIARNLLSVCMHESEQARVATVKSVVGEVLGVSWPIDQSYETSLPDPWEVAGKLACELDLEPLAALSIDVHPEKAGVMIVGIDEPALFQRRSSTGAQLSDLINTSVREAVRLVTAGPEVEEISNLIMETMFTISDISSAPSVRYFGSENYRLTPLGDMQSGVKSMLDAIFFRYNILDDGTEILVKSPSYFERLRAPNAALRPRGLLNYMGYRVFLLFAAFTSSSALQEVHSILAHRPLGLRDGTRLDLCAREVEHVLPAMYARAFFRKMRNTNFDGLARVWSSKVEQVFHRGLSRLSWFREGGYGFRESVDLLLAKHKLSTTLIRYFYASWVMNNASYAAYTYQLQVRLDQVRGYSDSGVKFMRVLYGQRFAEKIEPFVGHTSSLSFPASSLDASPKYDVETKSLFVPAAVMNASVPTNGSMFAFHIARYGVRLIKGLMPVLYNDFVFSSGPFDNAPLLYTQGYDRRLRDTVKCLVGEYYRAPDILKSNFMRNMGDISPAGFSLLEQTVALTAAYWAFQELLTVKRVWRSDFRFAQLPDLSSDQLFFVYYALDNCERSDDAYQARVFDARFKLPPEERVNFPLLQMDAFKRAFGCRGRSPMATASQCSVAF